MAVLLRLYAQTHDGHVPESWEELADLAPELRLPESPFAVGKGVSEVYSWVPREIRAKFPNGALILIRGEPILFPDAYKSRLLDGLDLSNLTPEQQQAVQEQRERSQRRDRPIRYLIFQNSDGNLVSDHWYEDDIQTMLKETGITIPRPTPYYPKGPDGEYLPLTQQAVEALVRLDLTDTIPPDLLAKMQTAGTLPANFTARGPRGNNATPGANSSATAPSTLAQITSSPWLGWVLAIAVALAAALYLRRQRIGRR